MDDTSRRIIKDTTGNPAPLGLMAFGMTTVLLNIHNAGAYSLNAMVLSMGFFYGGIGQVFAGWMEWKKGNSFASLAFSSYGLFWMLLAALIIVPKLSFIGGIDLASSEVAMGWFFFVWGIFSFLMFIATLRLNMALQVVFLAVTILFWLLAISEWAGSETLVRVAGWEGIFTGLSAMYAAIAPIWNEMYGRVILPVQRGGRA